jgi:Domain of unknown function (DUF222)
MIEHMLGSMPQGDSSQTTAPLTAAIDGLLDIDPDVLDDTELAEAVVEVHRQQARLAAAVTRLTAAADARRVWADDGSRSCGAWMAHRCRLPVGQARAEAWLGRRLRTMPATSEALAAGDLSPRHAMVLASLAGGRTAELFVRDEALLVDHARTMSWANFVRAIEYWHQHADPDGVERDADHDEALRRVHLSPGMRGTGILDGMLTPLGYATVNEALRRVEQELFESDWAAARAEHGDAATACHLTRTPAQRRHDALVELAKRAVTAPTGGKRPKPLISVFVGYETFQGRICQLAGGTIVSPGTVASLLDEALIERVVFDAPSRVIDLGRARRFTGAVRRALEVRDQRAPTTAVTSPGNAARATTSSPGPRVAPRPSTTASCAAASTTAGAGSIPTRTPRPIPTCADASPISKIGGLDYVPLSWPSGRPTLSARPEATGAGAGAPGDVDPPARLRRPRPVGPGGRRI